MKLFGKLLIAALIIGMLLPFTILKGKDGKPLMSFSDLKLPSFNMPEMPKLPEGMTATNSASGSGKSIIYKWTDADGNLQFSNSPPEEGIEFEATGYDPNLNVIQAVEVPTEAVEEKQEAVDSEKKATSLDDIGNVYSPESIEKLFNDAKNVEKLLNERLKNQSAQIGD